MAQKRIHTPEFKVQVVLESLQRDTTIEQVCRNHGLAPSVVHKWRKLFRQKAPVIFADSNQLERFGYPAGQSPDELKRIIGAVTVENDILKKALGRLG
jgi:transposase-like protein